MDLNQSLKYSNYQITGVNGENTPNYSEKINEFKNRLHNFDEITTLEEAKRIAKTVLPVSQEINHITIAGSKCTIINRPDLFRVSFNTPDEFICYNFE